MQQPELQGGQSGALLGWTSKRIAAEERVSRHCVQKRPSTEQKDGATKPARARAGGQTRRLLAHPAGALASCKDDDASKAPSWRLAGLVHLCRCQ